MLSRTTSLDMMLELLKLLVLAVLCSSTQGSLIQVSGNEAKCSDDLVFWCTSEFGFLNWNILTTTRVSFPFFISNGTARFNLTQDSSLVAQVTFTNGFFINATVTIMRPFNLNGGMIRCNMDTLTLNIPSNTGSPPTALNITQNNITGMLDILWNSEENGYCIQSSAFPRDNGIWNPVTNASYTLPLGNKTYEITISLQPVMNTYTKFTIGPCLFYDQLIMERNYTLDLYETWTVFQECNNSRIQFDTTCGSSGSWTTDMRCPTMSADNHITSTGGEENIISTKGTIHMTKSTKQSSANEEGQSQITLISSLIPIGVLVISAILVIIILIGKWRKKKSSSREYPAEVEFSEMTCQQLSNKPQLNYKPNTSGRQIPTEIRDLLQYGSLEVQNSTSISETSNRYWSTSHPAHAKKLKYTDVDTSDHNGAIGRELIHIKVDYADINLRARPEDKTLNLNSILIQLNPMSKDFTLFGGVAGISQDTLDKIVTSSATPYDGLVEVCDAWLDKCRKEKTTPTWSAVADILSLIGQDKLSHDIMQVYITGKLPIEVGVNSLDVQGEVHLPSPPPIPPYRDEGSEDTCSEVELMTVTSVMTSRQLPASRDTAMEEPPPIPEKLHDITPADENEEPHQALPELPPKLPVKEQQRKPVPARRKQSKDDEVMPSIPPRPPKITK